MISLPNFADYAESVNSDEELTPANSYDESSFTMEFSFEEHEILNEALMHYEEAFSSTGFYSFELPADSEVARRYRILESIKDRSFDAWKTRFGND